MTNSYRTLDVYKNNVLVGKLKQLPNADLAFQYSDYFLQHAQSPISLSLPLQSPVFSGIAVRAFFSSLLPDEHARQRIAKSLGVSAKNTFSLLNEIGGECAGALSLYPENSTPPLESQSRIETLSDDQLNDVIKTLAQRPLLAGQDGIRLSLAGAQNKIAVRFENNQVKLVKGTAATTHILKPAIADC